MRTCWLLVLLGACGGEDCPPGDRPRVVDRAPFVHVNETSDNQGGALSGRVVGSFVSRIVGAHDEIERQGDCRLLRFNPCAYCEEPCEGGCRPNGTCSPIANPVSAGTLTITGLSQPASARPDELDYFWSGIGPIFEPGAEIVASAPGAEFPSFTVAVATPQRLVVTNLDQLDASGDRALVVEWVPGAGPDARVSLRLFSQDDGLSRVVIECDGPDTGSLVVPQTMMAEYAARNRPCTECGLMRYNAASVSTGEGIVELRAASTVTFPPL